MKKKHVPSMASTGGVRSCHSPQQFVTVAQCGAGSDGGTLNPVGRGSGGFGRQRRRWIRARSGAVRELSCCFSFGSGLAAAPLGALLTPSSPGGQEAADQHRRRQEASR